MLRFTLSFAVLSLSMIFDTTSKSSTDRLFGSLSPTFTKYILASGIFSMRVFLLSAVKLLFWKSDTTKTSFVRFLLVLSNSFARRVTSSIEADLSENPSFSSVSTISWKLSKKIFLSFIFTAEVGIKYTSSFSL